ncbi:MAG: L,D-transpeptidase family protein [Deltaproteobacteria bacterium]|nr:L,D-transpeptidase family protein [Deltaproteobacteria bacterium]MBW1795926.1 L,D-transpeptidase family protein [Deltaproteobacteria bacterium]
MSLKIWLMTMGLVVSLGSVTYSATYDPPLFHQIIGGETEYIVKPGDFLIAIAGYFRSNWRYLARINELKDPDFIVPGQHLCICNRHIVPNVVNEGFVINLPERMAYYFEKGELRKCCSLAIGRPNWPTPIGIYNIIFKEKDPVWYVPKSIQDEMRREGQMVKTRVPPGLDNPLGRYRFRLSRPIYSIHATIWPSSIGQPLSHGCIRMLTDDIEELYYKIKIGTMVKIIYQPVKMAITDEGKIYLEVHPDVYRRGIRPLSIIQSLAASKSLETYLDWEMVSQVIREKAGVAINVGKIRDRFCSLQ